MCVIDRKTKKVVEDCGSCGCGQSKNWGRHSTSRRGMKCSRCGLYVGI